MNIVNNNNKKLEEAVNKNIVYLGLKNYNSGDTDYSNPEGVFHGRERKSFQTDTGKWGNGCRE